MKDKEIAKKMTTFIEINTIGVSKDSQIRAAKILQSVSNSCEHTNQKEHETFFDYSYKLMENRWNKIREAVNKTPLFSLPDFPLETCSFSGRTFGQLPGNFAIKNIFVSQELNKTIANKFSDLFVCCFVAFAWLKCEGEVDDCESFLRKHKIYTRGGKHFGASTKYVRISMLSRDGEFEILTRRLPAIIS